MELRDDQIAIGSCAEDDAPAVYAACQDREIQRWIPEIPRPYTLEHAREFVNAADGSRSVKTANSSARSRCA